MRQLQIISKSNINIAKKYFFEYLKELSQFDDSIKFDKNGNPIYNWFDVYWTDKTRYPFFLLVDDQIAGLAFVRELDCEKYEIAEFYVCKQFRKDSNAIWFIDQVTDLFNGQFVLSTQIANKRAMHFWDKFAKYFKIYDCVTNEKCQSWTLKNKNKR